jgi:signal transduction histidine kinase
LELAENLSIYFELVEVLPLPAYLCNAEGKIIAFNTQVEMLWGRRPNGFPKDRFCGALGLWEENGVRIRPEESPMACVLHSGNPICNRVVVIDHPDGTKTRAIASANPIKDRIHRRVMGGILVFQVFDCQSILEDLHLQIRARDEFLSFASHELKTPITTLELQIQLMTKVIQQVGYKNIEESRITQLLNTFEKQVGILTAMVGTLLDVTRISHKKLELELGRVDLRQVILDVVEQLSEHFRTAHCSVTLNLEKNVVGLWDKNRIQQVIVNLLSNAVKYGKGKPILVQMIRNSSETARLEVVDCGIGIAPGDQAKVFERFERVAMEHKINGLGLGLYIVKQIVLAHGGQIHLKSDLGQGACFTVELPLCRQSGTGLSSSQNSQ